MPVPARDGAAARDGGFTLIELMVALLLLAIVLVPFVQAYTSTTYATNDGRLQQAAVFVADTSLDQARAVSPSDLLNGRAPGTALSPACPGESEVLPAGDTTALSADLAKINLWESPACGATTTLFPFHPTTTSMDGYTFSTYWYVGTCYQTSTGCTAAAPSTGTQAALDEVFVDVTWPQANVCPQGTCSYVASTLFSSKSSEPTFNVGPGA